VKALQRRGTLVVGLSRSQSTADEHESCDVADREAVQAIAARVLERHPRIDLLVNNAGVNVPKPALELTVEDWDTVFDTNLKGSFFLTTSLARHWMKSGTQAAIVNIASQAGIVGIEERAAYGTSKAGLIHLTKILALEWASAGIRVNAVAPTFVRTELTASTLSRPDWAAELLSRIPIGRFGEPEDIAGAVAFLLSDAAALITGHTLAIDGGYTIR
jgi:NAD(P)-dependent dehydrogenase (short-subunit alcohol dehydrogenase family)